MKIPAKYWIPAAMLAVLIGTELTLRLGFGLGTPVLSQADPQTGYRFQPNQKIRRFGKRVEYNQYSQRSEPITPQKPPGTLRILITGDSVLNGGNPTDQAQIITELLEAKIAASGQPVEVLNASAGSWGIGNQQAYLKKFGTFGANAVILQIGTHDLIQPTSTSEIVGHHPAYPTQRPGLALQDAWTRYAWPHLSGKLGLSSSGADFAASPTSTQPDRQFKQNMQQLKATIAFVRGKKIPVFVLFTPNSADLLPKAQPPQYKSEFLRLLKTLQVSTIDTQASWSSLPPATVETYFRDYVHLSVAGNQAIADLVYQQLCLGRQLPACVPKQGSSKENYRRKI